MTDKQDILCEAMEVLRARGIPYGGVENNFDRIARRWNAHVQNRHGRFIECDAIDVAVMMIDLKLARVENQPKHRDSWVDIAGYAACRRELTSNEELTIDPM